MAKDEKPTTIHVALEPQEISEIDAEAARLGDPHTRSSVARAAIRQGLAAMRGKTTKPKTT